MKRSVPLIAIVVGIALGGAGASSGAEGTAARDQMPEIKVDRSPIERSGQPVITSYADALEEIRHSVVSIALTKVLRQQPLGFPFDDPFFRRFFGPGFEQQEERIQRGLGSGVIVSSDGYVLTNNHVVAESDEIRVALPDGREFDARVVGADPRTDVAVVKIEATDLDHATLADSDQLRVGDIVFAVGNPLGVGQTTTMGIVSATGRSNLRLIEQGYENFIQTDASINPGNSGGALVDARGRVVGINTAIMSTTRGNIGIGFAIPINLASGIMRSLIETGGVTRGYLGVFPQTLDSELAESFGTGAHKGVLIANVEPDSPAAKAGLQRGDLITAIDGHTMTNDNDLRLTVSQTPPGTTVKIAFVRDGKPREAEVVLGQLNDELASGGRADELIEGVTVSVITPELRSQLGLADEARGLVVTKVADNSRYGEVLPLGTVIEQINRQNVDDLRSARAALGRGRNIFLLNLRGAYRYVAITLY